MISVVAMPTLAVFALDRDTYDALLKAFIGLDSVTVHRGSICSTSVDCVIAPGQSYGFMDGGADRAINSWMSSYSPMEPYFSETIKREIRARRRGELSVGDCIIVNAPASAPVKYVAYAPTMKRPEPVPDTLNAYLALRAALVATSNWPDRIESIACTPMCTGAGEMPPSRAARQMRMAWDSFTTGGPIDWNEAWGQHRALLAL